MRILFQGDSITDAGRDKRNYFHMGNGYPKYAAAYIKEQNPGRDFEFINLGISGNRTDQLFDRLYLDAIALQPDVISILIGINDVWHRHGNSRVETTDEQFMANYRGILNRLRSQTNAKILILTPFLLPSSDKEDWRGEVERMNVMVRALAKEFAVDALLPLDEKFAAALPAAPAPDHYSADGVHPNQNGSDFIGKLYADYIRPLLQ